MSKKRMLRIIFFRAKNKLHKVCIFSWDEYFKYATILETMDLPYWFRDYDSFSDLEEEFYGG